MKESTKKTLVRVIALVLAFLIVLPMFLTGCASNSSSQKTEESHDIDKEAIDNPVFDLEKVTDREIPIEVKDADEKYIFSVAWQNSDVTANVDITAPDETVFSSTDASITALEPGKISILVDPAVNGTYNIHIVGKGLGQIMVTNSSWANAPEGSDPFTANQATQSPSSQPTEEEESSQSEQEESLDMMSIISDVMTSEQKLAYTVKSIGDVSSDFPEWDVSLLSEFTYVVAGPNVPFAIMIAKPATESDPNVVKMLGDYAFKTVAENVKDDTNKSSVVRDSQLFEQDGYVILVMSENVDSLVESILDKMIDPSFSQDAVDGNDAV